MVKRYCDKCKADITETDRYLFSIDVVSEERFTGNVDSYELCPACEQSFVEWLSEWKKMK